MVSSVSLVEMRDKCDGKQQRVECAIGTISSSLCPWIRRGSGYDEAWRPWRDVVDQNIQVYRSRVTNDGFSSSFLKIRLLGSTESSYDDNMFKQEI